MTRRRLGLVVAVLGAVALVGAWWASGASPDAAQPVPQGASGPERLPEPGSPLMLPPPGAGRPASAAAAASASSAAGVAPALRTAGPGGDPRERVEICGEPTLPFEQGRDRLLPQRNPAAQAINTAWYGRLADATDPRVRATGLALQWNRARSRHLERELRDGAARCGRDDADCLRRSMDAMIEERQQAADRYAPPLVTLALASGDVGIYALAASMCLHEVASPACRQVSAQEWARRESDNLSAWLLVLQSTAFRPGGDEVAEVLHQVAQARRDEPHQGFLYEAVQAQLPASWRADAQVALWHDLSMVASSGLGGMQVKMTCQADAMSGTNRRQLCEDVATTLATRSAFHEPRAAGIELGEQLGWSPQRLAPLKDEAVLAGMLGAPRTRFEGQLSCGHLQALRDHARDLGRLGEVGAARAAIARVDAAGHDRARAEWQAREQRRQVFQAAMAASAAAAGASDPTAWLVEWAGAKAASAAAAGASQPAGAPRRAP